MLWHVHDEADVVLDEQHRDPALGQATDDLGETVVVAVEPGRRLVEQEQLWTADWLKRSRWRTMCGSC